MANENPIYKVTDTELTSIADAIRAKTNTTGSLTYNYDFVDALKNFSSMPYTLDNIFNRNITELEGSTDVEVIPSYCFKNYTQLKAVPSAAFPNCRIIYGGAFSSCRNLYSVNFPACEYVGSAFTYCYSLTEINFPACSFLSGAFSYCSAMKTASFPVCSTIGAYTFFYCNSLSSVSLPLCRYIGNSAFMRCSSLVSVNFPACSFISGGVFSSCVSLTTASFPVCSYLGSFTFASCYNLKSLYLMSTAVVSMPYSTTFNSTPIGGYTASTGGVYGSVYVPTSLAATYKTATNWSTISARIVGI